VADRGGTAIGQVVQQRRGITGKPVRLAEPPPLLAGREGLLAELDARLAGGDGSRPRTVALTGLGGTGKTSVALEYAHRHLAEVGAAWQFAAEDPTVLAAGFGGLAAQLGARDVLDDARDPVASVHGVLAAFPALWLLVFDNAPDRASVERFLPPAGAGRVLITSRNALWPPGQAVEVPVLDPEVAAGFLAARTGDADHQAAAGLAEAVGWLPLALEQAAAYIVATGDSLAAYLASFRKRWADLLRRGQPTGYTGTVAATWEVAFTQLEHSDPEAAALLRLLAFCAPEPVPLRLLLQDRPGLAGKFSPEVGGMLVPLLEDELAARDAVEALRRYSLIRPAADGAVLVHRLVQALTADRMGGELLDAWRQAAAAAIKAALPDNPDQADTWPAFAALLPHAQAALADDSNCIARIADYLGSSGSYPAARSLQRRVLDARERAVGPEHPDTLAARHELGRRSGQAGDRAAARDLFAVLLPVDVRVLGPEHPDTLSTRHELAYWTGQAGDRAAARDLFAALLPVRERILGPEDPDTLETRVNLARWTGRQETRWPPGTCSPRCCPWSSGSSVRSAGKP
jgi:Tetratricopeptide repeat